MLAGYESDISVFNRRKQIPVTSRQDGNCSECAYFRPSDVADGLSVDKCCRNAPEIGGFPMVLPTDWCGQFEAVEGGDYPIEYPIFIQTSLLKKWSVNGAMDIDRNAVLLATRLAWEEVKRKYKVQ